MSNIKYIATGAITQQVFSCFILILLTRSLGADGYGQIVTFLAITTTIFNFSTNWVIPFVIRTESIHYSNTSKIGKAFSIPFLISFVLLMVAWGFIAYGPFKQFGNINAISKLGLLGFSVGFFAYQIAKTGYQIQQNFKSYGLMMILDKVVLLFGIAGLILLNNTSLNYVFWTYSLSSLLVGVVFLLHCLFKKISNVNSSFNVKEYLKSVSSVALSVIIYYFSTQPFVILVSQHAAETHLAAWLGIGYVMLGVLLQPFMWLAPTLLPKFSVEVNRYNAKLLMSSYIENTVLPANALLLWSVVVIIFIITFSPQLLSFLGKGFQGGEIIISLLLLSALPDAINMLLIQIIYAKKQENMVILMAIFKVMPFIIGYLLKQSMEIELILLNLGGWIGIGINLFLIRGYLKPYLVLRFMVIFDLSLLMIYVLLSSQIKELAIYVLIGLILPIFFYFRKIAFFFEII